MPLPPHNLTGSYWILPERAWHSAIHKLVSDIDFQFSVKAFWRWALAGFPSHCLQTVALAPVSDFGAWTVQSNRPKTINHGNKGLNPRKTSTSLTKIWVLKVEVHFFVWVLVFLSVLQMEKDEKLFFFNLLKSWGAHILWVRGKILDDHGTHKKAELS